MAQTWCDLLFAHWATDPEALRRVVPDPLALDTFEGRAYVGVTPFVVRNMRLRLTLPAPLLSTFEEINVRTYVTVGGKPGIFFFSLDAASELAVAAARRFYRLPYFRARISAERRDGAISYASERDDRGAPGPARFAGSYRGLGSPAPAAPGTLEHWLTERYCLYTLDERGRALRAEIHHPPWPLERAEAEIQANTMGAGINQPLDAPPLLHYSRRQDVVFWWLEAA